MPKLGFCEPIERCCEVPAPNGGLSEPAPNESNSEGLTLKEGFSALAAPNDGLAELEKLVRCVPKPRASPSLDMSPLHADALKFGLRDPDEQRLEA